MVYRMTDENHSTSTSPSKESKWKHIFGEKVANLLDTVYIDVYVFIFAFSVCITHVTGSQLVQDKICLNDLKLAPNVCQNIQERTEYTKQAVYIYRRTTLFTTYAALIIFIPSTLITFLLGRWIDRYPGFTKYVLVAPLFGNLVYCASSIYQCVYFELDYMALLYAKIPFGLLGGIGLFFSSTQTHITRKTLPENRSIRYGMLDFCFRMGFVTSLSLGGFVLVSIPWVDGQLRNYVGVYAVSAGCCVFAFIWVLLVIRFDDFKNETDQKDDGGLEESGKKESAFSSLFDPSNITSMWQTCFKKRSDGNHHRVRNLIVCIVLTMIGSLGEATITFQFVQKVYHWNAEYYSNVKSLTALMPAIGGILTPFILVHYLEMRDTTMAIIGSSAVIFSSAIKGGIMEPFAYFLGEGIGIFGILLNLSMRSVISRMVRPDEVGQIFTILSCFHSMAPIISAAFYTAIFNRTIEFYPGFVYHVVAVMKFYPLFVAIWLDLQARKSDGEQKVKNEEDKNTFSSFPNDKEMKEIQLKSVDDEKLNLNGFNTKEYSPNDKSPQKEKGIVTRL